MNIRRGDIYYADLSPVVGSEQGGIRPVLIVQNNVGNRFSPTVIAAAITSQQSKAKLPTHIPLHADTSGLSKDSVKAYLMANADVAERVEAQVRENLLRQSAAAPSAPAKAAERPIAVSADDFDDED